MPWFVYAIPLAMIALIAGAALYKYMQVKEAANWPSVMGKVVVSKSEVRKVEIFDDNAASGRGKEERNFAKIVYEYEYRGIKHRGDRVSIGEDLGNFEIAETIAKYPVGAVVTVYVNPSDPSTAVLERDPPPGTWGCVIALVVIGTALTFAGFYGFDRLGAFIDSMAPKPDNVKATIAFGAFGTVVALFAFGLQRAAARTRTWPVVKGKIVQSEVEQFLGKSDSGKTQTMYRSRIAYTYSYNGVDYRNGNQTTGAQVVSNMAGFAKRAAAKYPLGKIVQVYVDPNNPAQAVLDPRARGVWVLWIVAIAIWGVAYYASQR